MFQCLAKCLPEPEGVTAKLSSRQHGQRALPPQAKQVKDFGSLPNQKKVLDHFYDPARLRSVEKLVTALAVKPTPKQTPKQTHA